MQITLPTGTYVVAVSGGVDSIVLLDILMKQKDLQVVVAHFDHGIRHNSAEDALFVRQLATERGLLYEEENGDLGPNASEDIARQTRYAFLKRIVAKHKAAAVITAHHQDDVIETSIINLLRGTGRHGLTSLKNRPGLVRPLLPYPKNELIAYAKNNNLQWREDPTNKDVKFLRNKVRHEIVPKMSDVNRGTWLELLSKAQVLNEKIDTELTNALKRGLHKGQPVLNRHWFIMLPHELAKEMLIIFMRTSGAHDLDRKTIERLTVQIKTVAHGKVLEGAGCKIILTKRSARFIKQ